MAKYLTDDEVFGVPDYLSEDEVFGVKSGKPESSSVRLDNPNDPRRLDAPKEEEGFFSWDRAKQVAGDIVGLALPKQAPKPEAPSYSEMEQKVAGQLAVPPEVVSKAIARAKETAQAWAQKSKTDDEKLNRNFNTLAQQFVEEDAMRYKLDNAGPLDTLKNASVSDIPKMLWSGLMTAARGANELVGNEYDAQLIKKHSDEVADTYSNALRNELSPTGGTVKTIGESLGGMIPGIMMGGLAGEAATAVMGATKIGRAGIAAAEIANSVGAKTPMVAQALNALPSVAGAAGGEASVSAAQGAAQAADEFDAMMRATPDAVLASPRYKEIRKDAGSDAEAVATLREEAIRKSAGYQSVATFLGAMAVPGMDARLVGRAIGNQVVSKSGAVNSAVKFAREPLQEFVQSGGESLGSDIAAAQTFDPNKKVGDDALLQASQGALAGAGTSIAVEGPLVAKDKLGNLVKSGSFNLPTLSQEEFDTQANAAVVDAMNKGFTHNAAQPDTILKLDALQRERAALEQKRAANTLTPKEAADSITDPGITTVDDAIRTTEAVVNQGSQVAAIDQAISANDAATKNLIATPDNQTLMDFVNGQVADETLSSDATTGVANGPASTLPNQSAITDAAPTLGELRAAAPILDGQGISIAGSADGITAEAAPYQPSQSDAVRQELAVARLRGASDPAGGVDLSTVRRVPGWTLPDADSVGERGAKAKEDLKSLDLFSAIHRAAFGHDAIPVTGLGSLGVAYKGETYIDAGEVAAFAEKSGNPVQLVFLQTMGHEGTHLLEKSADPEDQKAYRNFQAAVLQYAKPGVLERRGAIEGVGPDSPVAASELSADVSGNFMSDPKFWGVMYDLGGESTVKRVLYRVMQAATKFYQAAKGFRLNNNNLLTEDGIAPVRMAAAQMWTQKANGKTPPSEIAGEVAQFSRGIVAEVAPNPDQEIAKQWREMTPDERVSTTRAVANKAVAQTLSSLNLSGWKHRISTGTYEGETNPNVLIDAPDDATNEQIDEAAKALGYVLDQKAMVTYDENDTTSDSQAGFVKVVIPAGMSTDQVNSLRKWIAEKAPQVDGDTMRDGALVFGNFTHYGDNPLTDNEYRAGILQAVKDFEWNGDPVEVLDAERYHSGYIQPANRDAYLEGTRYGEGNREEAGPGQRGDDLRGRQGRGDLEQLRRISEEAIGLRDRWIAGRAARHRAGGDPAANGARAAGKPEREYGTAREGSASAVGTHFSQQRRGNLSSAHFGTGLKGLERERLSDPANRDIKPRLNFYVDSGRGIMPEAGVGGITHTVKLNNLYPNKSDPLGLVKNIKGATPAERASNFERSVMRAGFDGYLTNNGGSQEYAVLIGKHNIEMPDAPQQSINKDGEFVMDDLVELTGDDAKALAELEPEQTDDTADIDTPPTKEAIAAEGLFAESAVKFGAPATVGGGIDIRVPDYVSSIPGNGRYRIRGNPTDGYSVSTNNAFTNDVRLTEKDAIDFMQRQLTANYLHKSGHDIASTYRKGTILKIAEGWRQLSKAASAFKLPTESKARSFSEIAKDMDAFPGYSIRENWNDVILTKDGRTFVGTITESIGEMTVCTMRLAGSDIGTNFYAVAAQYAKNNKFKFLSDDYLSHINTYRRTEQAFSYALKSGDTGVLLPGAQNRVYGYNPYPKTTEDHNLNIARLALANLRNVQELMPAARRLNYIPAQDKFVDSRGNDAEQTVKAALSSKTARDFGLGRATLARAVLTSQIISGRFKAADTKTFARSVMYSLAQDSYDDGVGEGWGDLDASGKPKLEPGLKSFMHENKLVTKDGGPMVWYHGTSRDIIKFMPKQADAVFLTPNPDFAETFAEASNEWMVSHYKDVLSEEQIAEAKAAAIKTIKADKLQHKSDRAAFVRMVENDNMVGEAGDYFFEAVKDVMPTGPNIIPLIARATNPFDFQNPQHIEDLIFTLKDRQGGDVYITQAGAIKEKSAELVSEEDLEIALRSGIWTYIESPEVQDALRNDLGHDAFYVKEGGVKNLAVYDPRAVKSYLGNNGNYDLRDSRISFSRSDDESIAKKFERQRRFNADLPSMLETIWADAETGNESAAVLRLIAATGFRIGGKVDRVQGQEAFGASTLRAEHVTVDGDVVSFNFTGKAQIAQSHSIRDAEIAADIRRRANGGSLFNVSPTTVRRYLSRVHGGKDYIVHDFRTWNATEAARRVVETVNAPTNPAEFKAGYRLALAAAASKIGDTIRVAEESYVDPEVFRSWRESAGVGLDTQGDGAVGELAAADDAANDGPDGQVSRQSGVSRSSREDATDSYIASRNKGLTTVTPQSVLDADIDLAVQAIDAVIDEIAGGNYQQMTVPVGPVPHVLRMLRAPTQMLKVDTGIIRKILIDKHSEDFANVSSREFVMGLYRPALVLNGDANGEYELVSNIITPKGPVMFVVKQDVSLPGNKTRVATVMSAYAKPISGNGSTIAKRVLNGKLAYADMLTAQSAITGQKMQTPSLDEAQNSEALKDGSPQVGRDSNQLPTIPASAKSIPSESTAVKPLNQNYAAWRIVKSKVLTDIANKKAKTDVDLVGWIGKHYKGDVTDAPAFSRQQPRRGQNYTMPGETRLSQLRVALQDYFLPVLEMQDALLAQGGTVTEASNVYRAEERLYGRVNEALVDFRKRWFDPMVEKAQKNGIDMDELSLYAYAKHAKERNAYIATIRPDMQDGGSGMTNDEADTVLSMFEVYGKADIMEDLHADLMAITEATRRTMLDEGLISQDEYDAYTNQYENYVPLRGFEEAREDGADVPFRSGGRGFNIRGKETTRALGRRTRAGDILENIAIDYEKAVYRGERNQVAKSFLELVRTNPDPGLWEVNKRLTKLSFDRAAGRVAKNTAIDSGPDTISVKIDGKEVYITIKDQRLLRAMRKSSSEETGQIERFINQTSGRFISLIRKSLTQYNPVFSAVNAIRDFQSGGAAALDTLGAEGVKLYVKHYRASLAAAGRHQSGTLGESGRGVKTLGFSFGDPVMDRYYEEYRAAGGTTGGYYGKSAEDVRGEIRNVLLANGAAPKGFVEKVKTFGGGDMGRRAMRGVQAVGNILEFAGAVSENAARVSAYRAARELGKTPAEAASIAKNLTTNFNRKGEWGAALNGSYLFFNAAVQGTHRVAVALKNKKVQGLMAGLTALGATTALMALAVGGDDDDDGQAYWDKIEPFIKERNLIIMLPPGFEMDGVEKVGTNGRYLKIPMAYGYSVFPVLGVNMVDAMRHFRDKTTGVSAAQAGINLTNAVMGSFNPLGGSIDPASWTSIGLAIAPTIGDIGIQLGAGVDSFNRPTSPYKGEFDLDPDSENVNARQAGSIWQQIARGMNWATGGDRYEPGMIDVTPGTLENAAKQITGGTGTFLTDVFVNLPTKLYGVWTDNGAEITPRDVPFLRNFYGEVDGVTDTGLLYQRRRDIQQAATNQKNRIDAGLEPKDDTEQLALTALAKMANQYTKSLSQIRREEIDIADNDEMSTLEKNVRRKELKALRSELSRDFNKTFMEIMREERDGAFK